ncbi:putative membrane protein [Babesia divergens]|uniref:Membrane protein n=1 Tax=Babesia divergens TaxID=32595 RepID=A0AAD9G6S5_BABDI|nr:putative membrane protein [Babesia divergens]
MASSRASQEKRCCGGSCGVDFTRFLDAGCMALFSIVLSCVFLLMFGETLRMINRTEFAHKDYVKRFLTRLFPFRVFQLDARSVVYFVYASSEFQVSLSMLFSVRYDLTLGLITLVW